MAYYPSERRRAGAKARIRSQSRVVKRCIKCRAAYDVLPKHKEYLNPPDKTYWTLVVRCPMCGGEEFRDSRVKD